MYSHYSRVVEGSMNSRALLNSANFNSFGQEVELLINLLSSSHFSGIN